MYRCKSWTIKKADPEELMHWTVVLQKTLESPLDCKEIKPVHPKGNQPRIFTGRTDAEAEAPPLWPLDMKGQFIVKDPDAGKDWRQEEKGVTEDEMVGWYHRLNGREFEQAPGDSEGHRSLACCSPWGHKERTWLSKLNNDNLNVGWPRDLFSHRNVVEVILGQFQASALRAPPLYPGHAGHQVRSPATLRLQGSSKPHKPDGKAAWRRSQPGQRPLTSHPSWRPVPTYQPVCEAISDLPAVPETKPTPWKAEETFNTTTDNKWF